MNRELVTHHAEETRLRDFMATLKRRWFLVFITIVVVMGLAALWSSSVTPVYRSVTSVEVEGRTQNSQGVDPANPISTVSVSDPNDDILSQIEVMQSYDVLRNAMQQLNLVPPAPTPDLVRDPQITVLQAGQTSVLQLSVDSRDPELALRLAQTVPSVYQQFELQRIESQLVNAIRFEQSQYTAALQQVKDDQQKIEQFRVSHNFSDVALETQSRLSNLTAAQAAQRLAAEALNQASDSLASIEATRADTPMTVKQPNTQSSDQYFIEQNSKLADLQGKLDTAKVTYKDNSPQVQELQAQVNDQKKYIKSLPSSVNNGSVIRNPMLDSVDTRVAAEKADYAGAKGALDTANQKLAQCQASVDEITKSKGTYDVLAQKYITAQNGAQFIQQKLIDLQQRQSEARTPVQTIGEATPPQQIKPNWVLNMIVAFFFSLIVAWATVSIYERWDDRIYSVDYGRTIDGLRSIGAVPLPSSTKNSLVVSSETPMADSFRVLRSNLLFTVSGEAMRSIAVVSARNTEGRSEIAANLAASLSMGSHQVILIDANLRRPNVHKLMNLVETPGLTDVLLGYKKLRDVIQTSSIEGLSVIPAGTHSQSTTELLSSEAFGILLDELKDQYHFIIVDTVACLAGADAQISADACDASLFVIRVGSSRKAATRYCIDLLKRTRTNLLGVIYNRPGQNPRSSAINYEEYEDDASVA